MGPTAGAPRVGSGAKSMEASVLCYSGLVAADGRTVT